MRNRREPGETQADQLRRALEEDIVCGAIPPGTRLDEQGLAARFGMSRTPVREALRQMSTNGLVIWKPRQGAVVAELTLQQIVSMFEVMAALEGLCGRLASRRMTASERQQLKRLHLEMGEYVAKGDNEGYHSMNIPFHQIIDTGSHNSFLANQAMTLHKRLAPFRAFHLHQTGRLEASYKEHTQIVDAVVGGQEADAAALLSSHVSLQSEVLGDLVSRLSAVELLNAG